MLNYGVSLHVSQSKTISADDMRDKLFICQMLATLIFVNLVIFIAIGSMGYSDGNQRALTTATSQLEWRPEESFIAHDSGASKSNRIVRNYDQVLRNGKISNESQTLTQIGDLKTPTLVTGVAYLDGRIYISHNSNNLLVFNAGSPNFDQIGSIQVEDLKIAVDLAADPSRKLLFIADRNLRIWTVNPNDPTSEVISFPTNNFTPRSISFCEQSGQLIVVATGSRLLLVYDVNDIGDIKLTMVQLPNTLKVRHAVRTLRGHFLVAHTGSSRSDMGHDQVTEFDGSGKVMRSYGGWRGYGAGQLNKPQYLAVADDGRVAVADSVNGRVVRLSSSLEYMDTIVEGVPVARLHLVEGNRQMIVGHKINVGVYRLR